MSEPMPERGSQGGQARKGLQKKIGPLPLWAWGGLGIGGALAVYFWQKNKKKSSATTSPTSSATTGAAVGTLASQVPQFVNQSYINPTPPAVTQTVNNTTNPPPPPFPPHKRDDEDDHDRPGAFRGHPNGGHQPGKRHVKPHTPIPMPMVG
jgi:hypothetical protein